MRLTFQTAISVPIILPAFLLPDKQQLEIGRHHGKYVFICSISQGYLLLCFVNMTAAYRVLNRRNHSPAIRFKGLRLVDEYTDKQNH